MCRISLNTAIISVFTKHICWSSCASKISWSLIQQSYLVSVPEGCAPRLRTQRFYKRRFQSTPRPSWCVCTTHHIYTFHEHGNRRDTSARASCVPTPCPWRALSTNCCYSVLLDGKDSDAQPLRNWKTTSSLVYARTGLNTPVRFSKLKYSKARRVSVSKKVALKYVVESRPKTRRSVLESYSRGATEL